MKLFTKLALVSAVAVSGSAMAMESMDDSALSSTTGQDGISIGLEISKVAIENLYIHDNDGLSSAAVDINGTAIVGGTGEAGAIVISGNATQADGLVITGAAPIGSLPSGGSTLANGHFADLTIDTDGNGGDAFLNINATVSGLKIDIGEISVAKSAAPQASGAVRGIGTNAKSAILSGLSLKTGTTTANIQLGNTPQGAMIKLNGAMTGGLTISNLGIIDNAGGGAITIDNLHVADHGGTNLSLDANVSVTPDGLKIEAGKTATDMYIAGINLTGTGSYLNTPKDFVANSLANGNQKSIGDVEVSNMRVWHGAAGLNPASTANGAVILISGHN